MSRNDAMGTGGEGGEDGGEGVGGQEPLRSITLDQEMRKYPEMREADFALLRDWADKQPHLPHVLDRELAVIMHAVNYNLEVAKKRVDVFFTQRIRYPDLYQNRDPLSPELQLAMSVTGVVVLPKTTPEGYMVVLLRPIDTEPSHFVHADLSKYFIMVLEQRMISHGGMPGIVFVADMQGCSLAHLPRFSIFTFKHFYSCVPDGMIFRLKSIHLINIVSFMDKLLLLMKSFMKKEISDVMHLHVKAGEKLYEFVPKDILPVEYGGTAPPLLELQKQTVARLVAGREYFIGEEGRATDESRRPKRKSKS